MTTLTPSFPYGEVRTESGPRRVTKPALLAVSTITAASTLFGVPGVGVTWDGTLSAVTLDDLGTTAATTGGSSWSSLDSDATDLVAASPAEDVTSVHAVFSSQEVVQWVKAHSGLTWDQLGKVFGVSRRAVHLWANGGRINATNEQTLRDFAAAVAALRGDTPDATRAALLSHGPDGWSVLGAFQRDRAASSGLPWGEAFTAEEKAGTGKEGPAAQT